MSKLTNFVIWNKLIASTMQEPKIYRFETKIQIFSWNAVIFASFLTGVVLNTLFSASGYRTVF